MFIKFNITEQHLIYFHYYSSNCICKDYPSKRSQSFYNAFSISMFYEE